MSITSMLLLALIIIFVTINVVRSTYKNRQYAEWLNKIKTGQQPNKKEK